MCGQPGSEGALLTDVVPTEMETQSLAGTVTQVPLMEAPFSGRRLPRTVTDPSGMVAVTCCADDALKPEAGMACGRALAAAARRAIRSILKGV